MLFFLLFVDVTVVLDISVPVCQYNVILVSYHAYVTAFDKRLKFKKPVIMFCWLSYVDVFVRLSCLRLIANHPPASVILVMTF